MGQRGPRPTPVNRPSRVGHSASSVLQPPITEEMLAVYTRMQELDLIYTACIQHTAPCRSDHPGRHCAECRECLELQAKLRVLCKVKNWDTSGVGADQPHPPRYVVSPHGKAAWRQAWALHCALAKAAAAKRKAMA